VSWPRLRGDYLLGSEGSAVAVVTLGSDKERFSGCGARIVGSCKTENLGLERIVANVVANPSIRFVVLAGGEVEGHRPGDALARLHRSGVGPDGRIPGALGAVPLIENIGPEAVERFRRQVELLDLVGSGEGEVARAVSELDDRRAGAFAEGPLEVEPRPRAAPPAPRRAGAAWASSSPPVLVEPASGLVSLPALAWASHEVRVDAARGVVSC
jgi:tetrahydromethanopterin S-methyltransferase subunit A